MGKPEDAADDPAPGPSFDDPKDPRWSQNPHAAPPRNPYLDQPLDAPPVGRGTRPTGSGTAGQTYRNGYRQQGPPQQGYPRTGYQQPVRQDSSVLSIVSLVAGIIGLFSGGMLLIPELVAIICGHLALRREPHMRGVAIAGLVTGYLGALFIVLLVAFFVVVFAGSLGSL